MSARKRTAAKARTSAQERNWRLAQRLLNSIAFKKPLDAIDRSTALKIIRQSVNGEDARVELGVDPIRGRPKNRLGLRNQDIATQFFVLAQALPRKKALAVTAKDWSISESTVEKISIEFRWIEKTAKKHAAELTAAKYRI